VQDPSNRILGDPVGLGTARAAYSRSARPGGLLGTGRRTSGDEGATVSDEYLLAGAADVWEVLAWTAGQAHGRESVV
jgi:hypothetical protein